MSSESQTYARFYSLRAFAAALVILSALGAALPTFSLAAVVGIVLVLVFLWVSHPERLKYAIFFLGIYAAFEESLLHFVPGSLMLPFRFGQLFFMAFALSGAVFITIYRGTFRWRETPIDVPLLAFVVVSALAFAVSDSNVSSAALSYQALLRFIFLVFYPLMLVDFDRDDAKRIFSILVAVALVVGGVGLIQSVGGPPISQLLSPTGVNVGDWTVGG